MSFTYSFLSAFTFSQYPEDHRRLYTSEGKFIYFYLAASMRRIQNYCSIIILCNWRLFKLTAHCPPPRFCFHHFLFRTWSWPLSCNFNIALLMGVRYGDPKKIQKIEWRPVWHLYMSVSNEQFEPSNLPVRLHTNNCAHFFFQ